MADKKVLVLCATGKAGKGICAGLVAGGFEVYGTTRSAASGARLTKIGVKPVVANYVVRADVERAIKETGCRMVVFITDYFLAARNSKKREEEQGKMMVDAMKATGMVDYAVFISVADVDIMAKRPAVKHCHAKLDIERYFLASGVKGSILRPCAFMENWDDPANYNPLQQGSLKFLTDCPTFMIATLDIGKAAAAMFKDQAKWNGKALTCVGWKGDLNEAGAAWEKVSGVKTKASLAMPKFFRSCFLGDLHAMCLVFEEGYIGTSCDIDAFKAVVPDALDAEGWFRWHTAA